MHKQQNSWSRVLVQKIIVTQIAKKFETLRFITVIAGRGIDPYPEPDGTTPKWHFILL